MNIDYGVEINSTRLNQYFIKKIQINKIRLLKMIRIKNIYHLNNLVFSLILIVQADSIKHNYITYGVKVIPHPDKVAKGGEDSNFVNNQLIAVADGVGGWNQRGIDPSLYSRELCRNIEKFWNQSNSSYSGKNLQNLIIASANASKSIGSSTLILLQVDFLLPKLHIANIGDSGYVILRQKERDGLFNVTFKSEEQQHSFNFPYQIGNPGDDANSSLYNQHDISEKDIIIVGSDGLFDNIDDKALMILLNDLIKENRNQINHEWLADKIGQKAFNLSLQHDYNSPFAKKAREHGYNFIGGKSDDITVVVATFNLKYSFKDDI